MKFTLRDDGKRLFLVCLGALIFSFNMKSFVRAGNLLPGGIAGITVLIQQIGNEYFHVSIPYSVGNLLLNSVPVFIGIRFVGKKFTLYSCLMIVVSSILTDVLPVQPITYDELLVAVFGGLINGFAIGLCLMGKASSGGLDIVAVYLSRRWNIDAWNYTLMLNAVILATAGLIFGWDRALYSIIFQFTSTQVVHAMYQKHRQHTLLIITNHSREVYTTISQCTSHGATVFRGIGSYDGQERDMVYSVVSSDEVKMVLKNVREVDPAAFINTLRTDYMTGRFIQKKED
ncbi:MAG TPA: YitT family protein [Candidatus Pullilachnospira stercoravium]|uniref:YitT family protein n=1 Tax=Candidatus Pullilachnospira stercoravium TaxID=2840913 RepID=A0A9D1NWG6_9FIRM|nr:YitT family protein [Candidatus Pullilachnospira stercoravium]